MAFLVQLAYEIGRLWNLFVAHVDNSLRAVLLSKIVIDGVLEGVILTRASYIQCCSIARINQLFQCIAIIASSLVCSDNGVSPFS